MRTRTSRRRGFTLVDMVVGAAISGVMMAIAVCTFSTASSTADTQHCHDNMEIIANLEMKYKVTNANHVFTTLTSALNGMSPVMPLCPDGGAYSVAISTGTLTAQNGQTVPAGKLVISCNYGSHGKYAPDIDTP